MSLPQLIGMVHLGPLPGSPAFVDLDAVVQRAADDAVTLQNAGFDAVMVENFGDAPFYKNDVPKVTVAAMTRAVGAVIAATSVPVGVNVLRNDGLAAVAIASATGASLVRVNVLSGVMNTDQGIIEGEAAAVARLRSQVGADLAVLADCFVKHATPPAGLSFADALADLWERAGADGVIVSGTGTGHAPESTVVKEARAVLGPDAPIYVGSGVSADNASALLAEASGAIIGSSVKHGGPMSPVETDLAERVVAAARAAL